MRAGRASPDAQPHGSWLVVELRAMHRLGDMAIQSLSCPEPIRRSARIAPRDHDALHEAIALHEAGDHFASLARTLEHLFPGVEVPDLQEQSFTFAQGSSQVTLTIADDHLDITVPLVRLRDDSLTTAALRYLLSNVSGTGQLFQPCLRGNEVQLEFRDRVRRLHPQKVSEVLRLMPFRADACDDWLIEEFSCEPLERASFEPLSDEEWVRAQEIWHAHWSELEELAKESQRKRSVFFFDEISAYAIYHLRHLLPFHGYLWSRVSVASSTFNDDDAALDDREKALMKCIREMRDVTPEKLRESVGHATYALSPVAEGTERVLRHHLGSGDYLNRVMSIHNAGHYMVAAVALMGTHCYLLSRYGWDEATEARLLEALALGDGQSWRACSSALLEQSRKLIAALDEDDSEEPSAPTADADEDAEKEPA